MSVVRHVARILTIALATSAALSHAAEARPNILFIMVDEMKWDVMGCAGHPIVRTPNLDRLAAEGTRFATAYTVAPICTPSRYSFFTARYAHVHGATDNSTPTREPQVLLPSILKQAGYQTALSGKLHFIPANEGYDFDAFWSFAGEGPRRLETWPEFVEKKHGRGSARRVTEQPFPDDPLGKDLGKLTYPQEDSQTHWITDRALEFLGKRDAARPFFLFVSYLDPHSPSHLCEPYWKMYDAAKMPLPPTFRQDTNKTARTAESRHEVNDPAVVKAMTAAYFAKVTMVDDNVGRLLAGLRKAGLETNTLIVFTADHGNMLGDLNRWFKGAMYEGSTRIPLLIKAPAFNSGAVVTNIVQNIDVMPTLCAMAGVPLPAQGIQGRVLTDLVAGRATNWPEHAFAERGSAMIRDGRFKLIRNDPKSAKRGGDAAELYDLQIDPRETNNLARNPAHEETVKRLAAALDTWQQEQPPVPVIEGVKPHATGDASQAGPAGRKAKRVGAKTGEK